MEHQYQELYGIMTGEELVRERHVEQSFIDRFKGRDGFDVMIEDSHERLAEIDFWIQDWLDRQKEPGVHYDGGDASARAEGRGEDMRRVHRYDNGLTQWDCITKSESYRDMPENGVVPNGHFPEVTLSSIDAKMSKLGRLAEELED